MWQKRLVVFVTFLMLFAFLAYGATISVGPKIGGGGGGTTIPDQNCSPDVMQSVSGGTFSCIPLPTAAPTPSPIPASTPVAGQALTGFGAGVSSPTRTAIQAPLPTATPTASKFFTDWNGTQFNTAQPACTDLSDAGTACQSASTDFDAAGTAQALITSSTSDPSPTPCTGLQGNFWRKVDSAGAKVDEWRCDCENGDNATNCVWHSDTTPVDSPFAISGGHLILDILGLTEDTTPGSDYEIVGQKISDSTYVKIPTSSFVQAAPTSVITRTAPMKLMTVSTANAYTYVNTVHGTNLDYAFVAYVDAQTGESFWIWHIPDDLATVPAWAIVLTHRATPTATGNVVLNILCSVVQTASDYDVALTSVFDAAAVATSGTSSYMVNSVLVKTGTDNDSTLALVAGATLTCRVVRVGGDGADTITAVWQLFDVSVRYNAKIN